MYSDLVCPQCAVPELEDVISAAIPDRFDPINVLSYRQVSGGVDVEAGEPISPIQRAALEAIQQR
jgi:hypothetical protein